MIVQLLKVFVYPPLIAPDLVSSEKSIKNVFLFFGV